MNDDQTPLTEEQQAKIQARRDANNAWRAAHKDRVREYNQQYQQRLKSGYYES
jgi:hypothetical protein